MADDLLADIAFTGPLIVWRGPAPFHFVAVPDPLCGELAWAARQASYGWGVVPVAAEANEVAFRTSLFPRDGGYLVPVKASVRRAARLGVGEQVHVRLRVAKPGPGNASHLSD